MIVFEDGIEDLVSQIPAIEGFEPSFHWGNDKELNRYIKLAQQPYPLVWLVTSQEVHDSKGQGTVRRQTRIIFATREPNIDMLNDYRLKNSYKRFLNPLLSRFLEGLAKNDRTSVSQETTIRKHPNYSEADENKTIDLWDAITLDCTITMNNNCQNTIQWREKPK